LPAAEEATVKRQFVTKTDIDRIVEEGRTVLEVDATTTVTDLALEHARQRGVTVRQAVPDATPHPTGSPPRSERTTCPGCVARCAPR